MIKKIFLNFIMLFSCFTLFSCTSRNILLFLNWGEYVDEKMLEEFEDLYNVEVVMDLGESNEIFYSKVRGGTTCYDVVAPSDYMVEKMYRRGMLSEIDFSKLSNFNRENLMPGVKGIIETLELNQKGVSNYFVPYLWGTWGVMYNKNVVGLTEAVTKAKKPWAYLFDRDSIPSGTRVSMYDSHLHAYYAACKYLSLDTTKELNKEQLDLIYNLVKNMDYDAWGTDDIKKDIVAGNRDLGFMWTGDFLYYYCENIASTTIDAYLAKDVKINEILNMVNDLADSKKIMNKYSIDFDIYIPDDTIAFCDNLVIPKNSKHYDLALKFIDFMCARNIGLNNVDPAYANTYYVSYNTPFIDVYEDLLNLANISVDAAVEEEFNREIKSGKSAYDTTLYWKCYDMAIGIAFEKYYPKEVSIELPNGEIKKYKGNILTAFERTYINTINNTFNDARA